MRQATSGASEAHPRQTQSQSPSLLSFRLQIGHKLCAGIVIGASTALSHLIPLAENHAIPPTSVSPPGITVAKPRGYEELECMVGLPSGQGPGGGGAAADRNSSLP